MKVSTRVRQVLDMLRKHGGEVGANSLNGYRTPIMRSNTASRRNRRPSPEEVEAEEELERKTISRKEALREEAKGLLRMIASREDFWKSNRDYAADAIKKIAKQEELERNFAQQKKAAEKAAREAEEAAEKAAREAEERTAREEQVVEEHESAEEVD